MSFLARRKLIPAGRKTTAPPRARAMTGAPAPAAIEADDAPRANGKGTFYAVVITIITAITLQGTRSSEVARYAAIFMALALAVSIGMDLRRGLRNIQRADLFAVLAYYFLTLFEFLFPQARFDAMVSPELAIEGVRVCLAGFAGLLIGRHLLRPKSQPFKTMLTHEIPAGWLIAIFWICCAIGYSNMLVAVHFDVLKMIDFFMAPRFTQPWSRGRLGDWKALLYELAMFIQLLPPLAGIMLARAQRYPLWHIVLMIAALLLTLFYGFASGTRNIFAGFLVTFIIGYSLALPPNRSRALIYLGAVSALIMCLATFFMLQFRDMGLRNYIEAGQVFSQDTPEQRTLYVDYNLYTICRLAEAFPFNHPFLGFEIPYQALVRPIPRALWPGKPEGLSRTIEDVMNVEGLTISASFAGEAYMSGGIGTVFLIGLALAAFMGWWSALGSPRNSEFGHLIYASGFVAAVISMRSLFVFTTALVPTVFAIVGGSLVVRVLLAQARRLLARRQRPMAQGRPPTMPPPRRA